MFSALRAWSSYEEQINILLEGDHKADGMKVDKWQEKQKNRNKTQPERKRERH